MQEIALFSGKIYTVGKIFTRPPVVTVTTNLNSQMSDLSFLSVLFVRVFLVFLSVLMTMMTKTCMSKIMIITMTTMTTYFALSLSGNKDIKCNFVKCFGV